MSKMSFYETPANQGSGSGLLGPKASPVQGFGYLPLCTGFDPTHYLGETSIYSLLVPSTEEIETAKMLRISGEKLMFKNWGEKEAGGVTTQTFNVLQRDFKSFRDNGSTSFQSRGIHLGIVRASTMNDGILLIDGNFICELENKGAESSILVAIEQAAYSCTNVAIGLLAKGLSIESCIVPTVSNNGLTIVFGVTFILYPSFPTFVPISKQLDLLNELDNMTASAYLTKITSHCVDLNKKLESCSPKEVKAMELEAGGHYYIKILDKSTLDRGLGLFNKGHERNELQPGLNHFFASLNRLYNSQARKFIEFPLSLRSPTKRKDDQYYTLIYRDLTKLGYSLGPPNKVLSPRAFQCFMKKMEYILSLFKLAGVLHVDLYPSNYFNKYKGGGGGGDLYEDSKENEVLQEVKEEKEMSEEEMDILIIDLDASHLIEEGDFHENVKDRLVGFLGKENVEFSHSHDVMYLDALLLPVSEDNEQLWSHISSGDKKLADEAFNTLLRMRLEERGRERGKGSK